ncbi:hypothetical protein SAMN04488096_1282 [Mesonia phycicola]|uniref:Lipoprotein n=1 Tax=Mesonia phycicola TaxID=579105 RepID=A0A1M6HXC4_9FLAO|nr:hypothetical protein [Mesonia phycicola]SHJ26882.1 hypothetical protein SAMN04488096_1282 [Mesonia phycicola]
MKKKFGYILIILILFSCNQTETKNTPEIEIFLTKKRIKSYQGLEISENNIDSLGYRFVESRFDFNVIRLDTTTNELIFSGEFTAKKTDLRDKPFLDKSRIIDFNPKNGHLIIDSIGAKQITELPRSNNMGHQFVLTVDGEPKLFGYFYSYPFSYYCHTYTYDFLRPILITDFEMTYGREMRKVDLEIENPELYKILSNRDK